MVKNRYNLPHAKLRPPLPPADDPAQCIKNWQNFAQHIVDDEQTCIMVITSNGISRFAPHITNDYENFLNHHTPKISTGAICIFQYENEKWRLKDWNLKPLI